MRITHLYLIILCFFLTRKSSCNGELFSADHISINCGSRAASTSLNGRQWFGDFHPKLPSSIAVHGSSTRSTPPSISADPVPYATARISRSQFSYVLQLNPGQKFIRLHFNPTSYNGFQRFNDFFTVEAGPFTLLSNFSASITADALAVNTFVKEFCIIVQENQPLSICFTPSITPSKYAYAFINGIEIISVPSNLNYCYGGGIGVHVVGTGSESVIRIGNSTAFELVHRQDIKWGSVSSGDDIAGTFGILAAIAKLKEDRVNGMSWRISVDVGFRYLVRIHFCDQGLRMVEAGRKDFILVINQMIVSTSADVLQERGNQSILFYKNYMVIVEGHRREGKRQISLSLQSDHVFLDRHGPLEGFEVFKLSNLDYNLASPNPLPPNRDSPLQPIQILVSLLGRRNALATFVFAAICLVNILVYMLLQTWGTNFTEEEENKPSTRTKGLCRHFSLLEIQSATNNFHDAFLIGKGGFGKVYRGNIGRETVAIKRLKPDSKQGKREFWTEVETLSELRHVNLVSLIGYCNEQYEMILVYEYMPNGTLADHLYKLARKNMAYYPLSWSQRLEICVGAGRGLDYLHTGQENGIIHRDVKASNILLDEKFVAKVSDFGLAKIKSGSKLQDEASTNLKGTFGYMDPAYFGTHRLTTESDTYSFGVVLLEVLCGRPAVEPRLGEDKRSLTMWARDNISEGQVDLIIDPSLREEMSPVSLRTFVKIAEKCLLDDPKKRPAIAHVIMKLQSALEQQENTESLVPKERARIADIFSSTDKSQIGNTDSLVPNERTNAADMLPQEIVRSLIPNEIKNVADFMPQTNKVQHEKLKSLSPDEEIIVADALHGEDRAILSVSTRERATSSNVQNSTTLLREQADSNMISFVKKDEKKSMMYKLSRKLWPWDANWKIRKSSKKIDVVSHALSEPLQRRTSYTTVRRRTASGSSKFPAASGSDRTNHRPTGQMLPLPNLRIFTLKELKAATRNFRPDLFLGAGGFGSVYKGWVDERSSVAESGTVIAVKMLNPEGTQGFEQWKSELNFLGRLSHPNLVKLLGYSWGDRELILVYEFMEKGSLENHLFQWDIQPLPWDIRLMILIEAARGLAFLHSLDLQVIYRDFKTSNILLDESYHAKLSDFGLAKLGPSGGDSHVTTQVMGTQGYAAPEYVATGHLYVKSDVYGFGVVLLEMLTGLRALDINRPPLQQILVGWIKPILSERRKVKTIIDSRLEGSCPTKSAIGMAKLALNCLEPEPKKRPAMQQVVEILENIDAAVDKPGRPRVHFT